MNLATGFVPKDIIFSPSQRIGMFSLLVPMAPSGDTKYNILCLRLLDGAS